MGKVFKILEYSACSNKESAKKLRFSGNHDLRNIFAMQAMLKENSWDFISVRDISYRDLKKLEPEMESYGYGMVIDPTWESVRQKWRYTCLSVLFVKNSIKKLAQIAGNPGFETVLRYVCVRFNFNGQDIYFRTSHIPCVDDTRPQLDKQIRRKEDMLNAEIEYQKEHQPDLAINSGDYNGAFDEDCYCKDRFEEFCFTDMVSESTYENHKLDHVYISDGLSKSKILVNTRVLDDYYMQFSDHKMVAITLEAG